LSQSIFLKHKATRFTPLIRQYAAFWKFYSDGCFQQAVGDKQLSKLVN
jgi:maltose-binding protein MalE